MKRNGKSIAALVKARAVPCERACDKAGKGEARRRVSGENVGRVR